jgi:hypothetical protein
MHIVTLSQPPRTPLLALWCHLQGMGEQLLVTLKKVDGLRGQELAYAQLSIALPCFWNSPGTHISQLLAATIINGGGMPVLLRLSQDVQRLDLKGLPKINAEKVLHAALTCCHSLWCKDSPWLLAPAGAQCPLCLQSRAAAPLLRQCECPAWSVCVRPRSAQLSGLHSHMGGTERCAAR